MKSRDEFIPDLLLAVPEEMRSDPHILAIAQRAADALVMANERTRQAEARASRARSDAGWVEDQNRELEEEQRHRDGGW